jgi:coenzyme F420-reducing hydrogenase beta subunit
MARADALERVDDVAARGLCHRCGVCGGLCPAGAISFDRRARPAVSDGRCRRCGLCLRVCAGWEFAFRAAVLERRWVSEKVSPIGPFYNCSLCESADDGVRKAGACGGFVTQALSHWLRAGRIGGALVVGPGADGLTPRAMVARTEREIAREAVFRACHLPAARDALVAAAFSGAGRAVWRMNAARKRRAWQQSRGAAAGATRSTAG